MTSLPHTFIVLCTVFELVFIVAAIVFPQSIYPNIKMPFRSNNNKKRFAIYFKRERTVDSAKEKIQRIVFERQDLFMRG